MPWLRVDDELFLHPKWIATPPTARALWITALSYAGKFCNGGRVHPALLPMLGGSVDDAESLVASGLWEKHEGEYQIHDFENYNESSTPAAKADLSEKRAEAGRIGGRRSGESRASNAEAKRSKTKQNEAPVPEPVPSPGIPEREGLAVEIHSSDPEPLFPPPPSSPDDGVELKDAHPEERRLYEAFRSVRFPRSIPSEWELGEWRKDLPTLRQMAHRGIELAEVKRRTQTAIDRGWPSVTLKAVWQAWGDLGEDLPARPKDDPPPTSNGPDSRSRISEMLDRMQERHMAGGYQA